MAKEGLKIKFTSIINDKIFPQSFTKFECNNEIEFSSEGIAVIYAPNGVGKTSLAKVLAEGNKDNPSLSYECSFADSKFIVIKDQNSRNITSGEANEFFIGKDINLAIEIEKKLESLYSKICNEYYEYFKQFCKFSSSNFIVADLDKIDSALSTFTKDVLNVRSKGNKVSYALLDKILTLGRVQENKSIEPAKI